MDVKVKMPGMIISYEVQTGDVVKKGDTLAFMEAMKMKHCIVAPADGRVFAITAPLKTRISAGTIIMNIE